MLCCAERLQMSGAESGVSPIKKKEGENSREVGWGGVGRQVEDEQDNNAAGGWNQVVELRREGSVLRAGHSSRNICTQDGVLTMSHT